MREPKASAPGERRNRPRRTSPANRQFSGGKRDRKVAAFHRKYDRNMVGWDGRTRTGPDEITINDGLIYTWSNEDRGVQAAFDRTTNRAYYFAHFH